MVIPYFAAAQVTVNFDNPASGGDQSFTWQVPAGVTAFTVACWGGGGSGSGNSGDTNGAGGGGGGAYSKTSFTGQTPGTTYNGIVGGKGIGTTDAGTDGGDSWFISNTTLMAKGGKGGKLYTDTGTGGAGGQAGEGYGDTKYSGGNGGNGSTSGSDGTGGGGGSAAAATRDGNNGGNGFVFGVPVAGAGGDDPDGAGNAGAGGNGRLGGETPASQGSIYGGGGGGTGDCNGESGSGARMVGGSGANGRVVITYTCPANAGTLSGNQSVCLNGSSQFSSTVPGGSWSSGSPGIANINATTGAITPVSVGGPVTMTYTVAATGCTPHTATRTVSVISGPSIAITSKIEPSCYGYSDGSITVQASGGTGPYEFSKDNGDNYTSGSNPYNFSGLPAGPHKIRVKDNTGCQSPIIP